MRSSYPPEHPRKPLWSSWRRALAAARRRHQRRLAARQPRELLAAPEQRRRLEAGRFGVLALAGRVALLAAVRLAVEALDHAERDRAVVGVRRRIRVRALPRRPARAAAERPAVDDRHLREIVLRAAAAQVAAHAVPRERRAADRDELG